MSGHLRERGPRAATGDDHALWTAVVLEPDAAELARLRAEVARWLHPRPENGRLVEDVVLVASEMAEVAIGHCDTGSPVVVDLRRTHSIVVVEVACHLSEGSSTPELGAATGDHGPDVPAVPDLWLMERLADRVTVSVAGRIVTLSGTFHLTSAGLDLR